MVLSDEVKDKAAKLWRDNLGMSYRQVADECGAPFQAIKNFLQKIKQQAEKCEGSSTLTGSSTSVAVARESTGGRPIVDLRRGVNVRIHGLQSAAGAELNGKLGCCLDFDSATGRWGVKLGDGTSKALKPANLSVGASEEIDSSEPARSLDQNCTSKLSSTEVVKTSTKHAFKPPLRKVCSEKAATIDFDVACGKRDRADRVMLVQ